MNPREAAALIESAVGDRRGTWADIGAGDGTFTRTLADLLGQGSRIYAVDTIPRNYAGSRDGRHAPVGPYPIDDERLPPIAASAGLTTPTFTATRPSLYGGAIYVAAMDRVSSRSASVGRVSSAQQPPDERAEQEIG